MSERRQLALLLAPYVLGLSLLVAAPALVTFALSVTEYDLVGAPSFVGLDNYRELLEDDVFRIAVTNSLVFAAIAVPLRLAAALGLALLLHRRMVGVGVYRAGVVVPTVIPEIAYGLLWLWLLNPLYGPINTFLGWGGAPNSTWIGYPLPQWLTHPNDARAAIVILSLFTIGEGFVILLVTRQGLPAELYDLAAVEDVTAWGLFRRVTLPLMAPVLVLLLIRDTIFSLQSTFVPALVVTDGGPPLYSTTYVPLFVYRNAFEYLRYGYASAAIVLMLLLTAAAVAVQLWILRRWTRSGRVLG
jgi:multiple sugar transport system permease protein